LISSCFTSMNSFLTLTSITLKQRSCSSIPQMAHYRTKTYLHPCNLV
jgi:hypothetical protein